MTKPIDGITPADQESEENTGLPEVSRPSDMDSLTDAVVADAPAVEPDFSSAPEANASVDFVLAPNPETPEEKKMEPEAEESVFGGKAKEADSLWASLSKDAADDASGNAGADAEEYDPDMPEDFLETSGEEGDAAPDADKKAAKPRPFSPGPFDGKSFGPVVPSRPMMCDEDGNIVPTPATITSRLFTLLALIPILLPVALFLVQVVFTLDTRSLWYSDEVRYASAYRSMVDAGNWLVLHLNDAIYPDKPPLFFWFLHGLDEAIKLAAPFIPFTITVSETMLFFLGIAISGLLCLLATHALASLVARVDRRTVLAADLILLSGFFFAALNHYLRMDLLFTACITLSHVFLFHAWVRNRALFLMVLGYAFAGLAVLVKGPLGFALPLLTGICFLIWQGRFLRFFKLDAIFGLLLGLAVPGVWLALAWMNTGDAFLNNILYKQILARALDTWHHAEPWYHYLMTFPAIWMPWTLVFLFLPWGRFLGKEMREGIKTSRTKDGAGIAYLWCAFLPGFILLSAISIKIPIYCLPLFPPLAILCARAILRMRPFAAACLQYSLALLLLLLGLFLVFLPATPGNYLSYLSLPFVPRGVMVLGGICLFFACVLGFLIKPRRGEGSILAIAFLTTALAYPTWTVTAPSLDAFLSPKAQATVLKEYRGAGYFVATHQVYPGTYTYYAGTTHDSPTWEDALAKAGDKPKAVFALRASFWDNLKDKPEGFSEVHRQTIAERKYVLVARPPLGGPEKPKDVAKPAEAAAKPEAAPAAPAPAAAPAAALVPETPAAPAPEAPAAQPEAAPEQEKEAVPAA